MKANREAPHVSFSAEAAAGTRGTVTVDTLVDTFKPQTALEVEMAATFQQLRRDTGDAQGFPEDASVSFEEFCKRQNEMAKLKALLSYHDKVRVCGGRVSHPHYSPPPCVLAPVRACACASAP